MYTTGPTRDSGGQFHRVEGRCPVLWVGDVSYLFLGNNHGVTDEYNLLLLYDYFNENTRL